VKFAIKLISILSATLLSFVGFSCKPKGSAVDLYYFNTPIHIETHGKILKDTDLKEIETYLLNVENEFDLSNASSCTYQFNSASENHTLPLSETAVDVIAIAKSCYDFSDGKFNPAVYPLVKLWQFSDGFPAIDFTPPSLETISATINSGATDFTKVVLDENGKTLNKTSPDVKIDLGGIVKGYASDKVGKLLLNKGYEKGYVSVGSSSLFILESQSLSVRHPRPNDQLPTILKVNFDGQKNLNVSTSGDYERYYIHGDKIYSHLINPKTGYPVDTGVISATIIGADGAFSDAITTALCVCSHQSGKTDSELILLIKKILTKYSNVAVFAVFNDGNEKKVITNKTEGEYFTLLDKDYSVVNI